MKDNGRHSPTHLQWRQNRRPTVRTPNVNTLIFSGGEDQPSVRAESGEVHRRRVRKRQHLPPRSYLPDARCVIPTCGDNPPAIRTEADSADGVGVLQNRGEGTLRGAIPKARRSIRAGRAYGIAVGAEHGLNDIAGLWKRAANAFATGRIP